jgi:prephenate dehydrogenase
MPEEKLTNNKIKKVAFIGLGLVGGSMALLIRQYFPKIKLAAIARSENTISYALNKGIIDEGSTEISQIPKDTDVVFICTPIDLINSYAKEVSKLITKDLIITDVGSVKENICKGIAGLRKTHTFIGGHPMAGSDKVGIEFATAKIMQKATYILIQQENKSFKVLREFLVSLDFKVLEMNAQEHDLYVAVASHMPYLLAHLIVKNADGYANEDEKMLKNIISSGFRDTTRVANSDPTWGKDICLGNKKNLLYYLERTKQNIQEIEALIKAEDSSNIKAYFAQNKAKRSTLLDLPLKREV